MYVEGKPKRRSTRVKAVDTSLVAEATQILAEVEAPVQKKQKRATPVVDAGECVPVRDCKHLAVCRPLPACNKDTCMHSIQNCS